MKKNIRIIMEEMQREIEYAGDYLEERLKSRFPGILGAGIRKVARMLFNWIMNVGALERFNRNFEFVLKVAPQLKKKDLDTVVKENLGGYLKTNEVYLRANKKSKLYPSLEQLLEKEFASRLKIYSRLVEAKGDSYSELVRDAYPEKKELKKMVEEQFRITNDIIHLLGEGDLVKVPLAIRSPVMKVISSSFQFMKEKILEDIEKIYSEK